MKFVADSGETAKAWCFLDQKVKILDPVDVAAEVLRENDEEGEVIHFWNAYKARNHLTLCHIYFPDYIHHTSISCNF